MGRYILKFFVSVLVLYSGTVYYSMAQKAAKAPVEDDVYDSDIKARKVVYRPYVAPPKTENKATEQTYADEDEYAYSDENQDGSDNDNYANDYDYTSRIDRFHRNDNFTWRNYYGNNFGCNGFCDDPFYGGFNGFNNFGMGFGVGIGFGDPFWGNRWGMGWNNWNQFGIRIHEHAISRCR